MFSSFPENLENIFFQKKFFMRNPLCRGKFYNSKLSAEIQGHMTSMKLKLFLLKF